MAHSVFVHDDNSLSSPSCPIGKGVIYQFAFNKKAAYVDLTESCGQTGCTCQNESAVSRKATDTEAIKFVSTINQLVAGSTY